jgi:hypothetical protein
MIAERPMPPARRWPRSPFHLGGVEHRADAGGDAAAEQADLFQRGVRVDLGQEISGSTVYSLKVEVPM